jgi:trehalose/maltose hydrolase-like predicted phosphorylase
VNVAGEGVVDVTLPGAELDAWSLRFCTFDDEHVGAREALCTLGNGVFATRGASCLVQRDGSNYPGTYRAGLYDRTSHVVHGRTLEVEDLVNVPNWTWLELSVNGVELRVAELEFLEREQVVDFACGVLTFHAVVRDVMGRTTRLRERRLVHLELTHVAALELSVEALDWSGTLAARSRIDAEVENQNVEEYRGTDGRHWQNVETGAPAADTVFLRARTSGTRTEIALATRTRTSGPAELRPGEVLRIEKVATLFTSDDYAIAEPLAAALRELRFAPSFEELRQSQAVAWQAVWKQFAIETPGQEMVSATLRFHLFHLAQSLLRRGTELDAGIPARGLHGEGYRGHVFWDELFVLPLISCRLPELARSFLMYRFHRLPEARRSAREAGLRGALFPWRSASDGREVTDELRKNPRSQRWIPDHSRLQRHIGSAIAYNVWHYHRVTGDLCFLEDHGAELLLEIARCCSSLASFDPTKQRYVIRGVVGPDEFHDAYPAAEKPGIDNNAYTNVMAVWTLGRALGVLDLISHDRRQQLCERLELTDSELERWRDISRRMFVPLSEGIILQFEGYERLEPFDWDGYRAKYGDIHRLDNILEAEGDTPNRYQASKQADVLMLFYLLSQEELAALFQQLGYDFDGALQRNVDFYLSRSSHGSTLSRVVHAWVLASVDRSRSWSLLLQALGSDLRDVQRGTTGEGLHLGAMAGTVDIFQRCYLGLEHGDEALHLNPLLPPELPGLSLRLRYRNAWLLLEVTRKQLCVSVQADAPHAVQLRFRTDRHCLKPGERIELRL